jgi:hemolysin III
MDDKKIQEDNIRAGSREAERMERLAKEFHRSRAEEWANGISHLLGIVFGIVALTLMCVFAAMHGNAWHVTSCAIYGATIILLYKSSMMYHLVKGLKAKRIWQIFDHSSIYLLIAGTYTPYALVTLRGSTGWWIFGVVWALALLGIFFETLLPRWAVYASLPIYLLMGWLIVFAFGAIRASLPYPGLLMLVIGGVVYTLGVIFYCLDRVPYMHTIWHLFVLGGTVCHWVSIMFYVIPE